ncbi:biotin-dependent carboxyltransferase family protein [Anaerolinea thermophila]|nr:biotin-dependent carboxyltransferase family protein [Anaerolinea thermophila]
MAFWVEQAGWFTTVQDLGRTGYEHLGLPAGGAMDPFACKAANRLVGNEDSAAVLEFSGAGPTLWSDTPALIALCGGGFTLWVDGMEMPAWTAVRVRAGQRVECRPHLAGFWGVLAVSGGWDVPEVLGSRSTFLKANLGGYQGRLLQPGDWLFSLREGWLPEERAGAVLPASRRPVYSPEAVIRVVPGPQCAWFGEEGEREFLSAIFQVSAQSDRLGYRLTGATVPRRAGELLSEGIPRGAIQVPPDGNPIVMMADHPTTGGYPKIAGVIRADWGRMAQLRPGEGKVCFETVTLEQAHQLYRELMANLNAIELENFSFWMRG